MKRSELKRKTPLARGNSQLKRTPIRKQSKKRRKLMAVVGPERRKYVENYSLCACCMDAPATDCHEITRGPHRETAIQYPQTWLAVCRKCHDEKLATMSIARQLCLKYMQSPEFYDRPMVNVIRKRAADAVSEKDVLEAMVQFYIGEFSDTWRGGRGRE